MLPHSATPHPRSDGAPLRLYASGRSSASYRVRIALHHKQLPFELVPVSTRTGEQRSREHRARNPMGQVPVLAVEDTGGGVVHLSQSLAIIEYLEERYPDHPLLPRDALARARARELAEIVNAGIQPLQNSGLTDYLRDQLQADEIEWIRRVTRQGLEALAARAQQTAGRFMVGDAPSLADVCLVPQLYNAGRYDVPLFGLETLLTIGQRCRELPGWERAHPDHQPDTASG